MLNCLIQTTINVSLCFNQKMENNLLSLSNFYNWEKWKKSHDFNNSREKNESPYVSWLFKINSLDLLNSFAHNFSRSAEIEKNIIIKQIN